MAYTENKKAIGLDAKTTPIDADVLVVGDTADSDRAKKTTWANIKATLKTYFDTLFVTAPASSTDNAIARFDGTTGKVLQNSGIAIRDFEQSGANEESIAARYVASGTSIDLAIFAGGTNLNGRGGNLRIGGNEGNGAFPGGSGTLFGAQGGATGAGGAAVVQGGAGGATSGEGGTTYVHGGDATAGNSRGGNIIIAPGTKQGSEINGITSFKAHRGSTYVAAFNFDNIASSDKTFTFLNATGYLPVVVTGLGAPVTTPESFFMFYYDQSNAKLYFSAGTGSAADWKILN